MMPKNILIFSDGTGQAGGVRPDQQLSNIYKLYRATRVGPDSIIDPKEQVAFYDPGLGTASASGAVQFSAWERIKSIAGLAVGLGFSENVIDCYEAILKRYEPGDRIYLFGFSRGGYTVRAVANVLNLCGVPTADGQGGPLPRAGRRLRAIAREAVVRVYEHGAGGPREKFEKQRENIARRFRAKYQSGSHPNHGDVHPEFIGVFDAVAALGLRKSTRAMIGGGALLATGLIGLVVGYATRSYTHWNPWYVALVTAVAGIAALAFAYVLKTFRWASSDVRDAGPMFHFALWNSDYYDRYLDERIPVARHALAVDETRKQFGRVKWGGQNNADKLGATRPHFRQRWFPGNHSDIGGSYAEDESRLSDISLSWIIEEALMGPHPILLDREKLRLHPDPAGPQHSEVFAQQNGSWWARRPRWPVQERYIDPVYAELDPSVIARLSADNVIDCDTIMKYRPQSLRGHTKTAHLYGEAPDGASHSC